MGVAIRGERFRWPAGIVPYEIHPELTVVKRVEEAMVIWEHHTQLRFVRRRQQTDFVFFAHGQQCSSAVGRVTGPQKIHLAPNCSVGAVIHEIGHAVGLYHEHQRPDRDNVLHLERDHFVGTLEEFKANFKKKDASKVVMGRVYDLRSRMHYEGSTRAKSADEPMFFALDQKTQIKTGHAGERLSGHDKNFLKEMYPPRGVVRRSDDGPTATQDPVRALVAVPAGKGRLWVAARTMTKHAQITSWRLHPRGGVTRSRQSSEDGAAADTIAIATAGGGDPLVTAQRTMTGKLRLIRWRLNGTPRHDAFSGDTDDTDFIIRLGALAPSLMISASQHNGRLRLISWNVNRATDGPIARLADSGTAAGAVQEISLLVQPRDTGLHNVLTTVRTTSGRIKVIWWHVSTDGKTIRRAGDSGSAIGHATEAKSIVDRRGRLVVALRTRAERLKIITLALDDSTQEITRLHDSGSQAGVIRGSHALCMRNYGVLSVVRQHDRALRLIKWRVDRNGRIDRGGDSGDGQAGPVKEVAGVFPTGFGAAPVVVVARTMDSRPRLITWDDVSLRGEL